MKLYICRECGKELQNLKLHIQHGHKKTFSLDDYWNKYPEDRSEYDLLQSNLKNIRRAQSPNCIEFYIAKGMSQEDAKIALRNHRNKLPFAQKDAGKHRPTSIKYWENIGYSPQEAKEQRALFQSHSKKSYIIKYGEVLGKQRHKEFSKKLLERKPVELLNIQEEFGVSEKEAISIFNKRRSIRSPRSIDYWIHRGHNEIEAKKLVSNYQSALSPRCEIYWTCKGFTETQAKEQVSKYQDFNSIPSIMKRFKVSFDDAIDIQDKFFNRYIDKYKNRRYNSLDFKEYSNLTRSISNRYYSIYKDEIDPDRLRGEDYHMDHILSIINGYMADISPEIVGHIINLRIIDKNSNLVKNSKSHLEVTELIDLYHENKDKYKIHSNFRS